MSDNQYDENGDYIPRDTRFRQVGWQIQGGPNDKKLIWDRELPAMLEQPHGGYSPVYVEVDSEREPPHRETFVMVVDPDADVAEDEIRPDLVIGNMDEVAESLVNQYPDCIYFVAEVVVIP